MAKNINLGKKFLSELKLYTDYFKWNNKLNRYENWDEACEDIIDGHRKFYSAYYDDELEQYFQTVDNEADSDYDNRQPTRKTIH